MGDRLGPRFGSRRVWLVGAAMWGVAFLIGEGALRYLDVLDPPAFAEHPDYGYLMKPSQSVATRGLRFQINREGFRGADFGVKPRGVTRIAFIGDSITYGGGSVADDDLFVARVPRALTAARHVPHEGINMSAPGWGIQNMAAYVGLSGVHEADWVVWVISSVDFRRPKTTMTDNGFWHRKPLSRFVYAVAAILHKSNLLSGGEAEIPGKTGNDTTAILNQNIETLRASLLAGGQRSLRRVIVIVPVASETAQHQGDAGAFKALADELALPFFHLSPAFQGIEPSEIFSDGIHLTTRGHEVAANAMATHLGTLDISR